MKTLELKLPDTLEFDATNLIRFLASKLYESGKVSMGQAAEIAGLTKASFSEILADYGVSIINYTADEAIHEATKI